MRIDPSTRVLDIHILEIRRLLRRIRGSEWSEEDIAEILGLSSIDATRLVEELLRQELVSKSQNHQSRIHGDGRELYQTTVQGNALSMAPAGKPIYRRTAERLVNELLERVMYVNSDDRFVYAVTEVRAFGSYLTEVSKLNDIDLAISLEFKESDTETRGQLIEWRVNEAISKGRTFQNVADRYLWPWQEVLLFLRNRSKSLSLHVDDPIVGQCESRVLFSTKTGQAAKQD